MNTIKCSHLVTIISAASAAAQPTGPDAVRPFPHLASFPQREQRRSYSSFIFPFLCHVDSWKVAGWRPHPCFLSQTWPMQFDLSECTLAALSLGMRSFLSGPSSAPCVLFPKSSLIFLTHSLRMDTEEGLSGALTLTAYTQLLSPTGRSLSSAAVQPHKTIRGWPSPAAGRLSLS